MGAKPFCVVLACLLTYHLSAGILQKQPLPGELVAPLPDEILEEYRKEGMPKCPCAEPSLCLPVKGKRLPETFGFYSGGKLMNWTDIPLGTVTSIAWAPMNVSALVCEAHARNTRLIARLGRYPLRGNTSAQRRAWMEGVVMTVKAMHFDGVNFDYERPMNGTDPEREVYVGLVNETRSLLREHLGPDVQVSVDVAWSPSNIDKRNYPYLELAKASDYLYVMDYDTRSQVFGRCIAGPNAPMWGGVAGMELYISLGIPKEKLIWGVPWYGYEYPCLNGTREDGIECPVRLVPFRGVNCSDAAGRERAYAHIEEAIHKGGIQSQYDTFTESAWFKKPLGGGRVEQYWYDSIGSIRAKAVEAKRLDLGGWGPFCWTYLDPHGMTGNPNGPHQAKEIWSIVKAYHDGSFDV